MLSRGAHVTVAVVDTGVSRSTPALAGRVLPGRDVATGGPADTDCAGRGTFVAGLVAGAADGPGPAVGIAPDARILPVRVSDRADDVGPDVLAAGIEAAVRGGASVVAVVATAPSGSAALRRAVAYAASRDVLVVAPALTQRAADGDVAYPAALPDVVSVSGIGPDGAGPAARPARRPTLCAPAGAVLSVGPAGHGTVTGSGVSLGVGFVAGAAALVRGYLPALPAAGVRDRLAATADPVADPALGRGVVDPVAAVTEVLPPAGVSPAPPAVVADPISVPAAPVADGGPGRAALGWACGVPAAAALAGLGWLVVASGRRRSWRPGPG
jgi:hypothetical protein